MNPVSLIAVEVQKHETELTLVSLKSLAVKGLGLRLYLAAWLIT